MKKSSLFILIIFGLFALLERKLEKSFFPITEIQITTPLHRVSSEEVKKTIMPSLGGFFSTNTHLLKEELTKVAFVDDVTIRRSWPHALQIAISEQELLAIWNEHEAVNSKGNIIAVNTVSQNLPVFKGPRNQANQILLCYKQLTQELQGTKLAITQVELNDRGSWQILLNDQYRIILGRKDINCRFNRFVQLWHKLPKKIDAEPVMFDLRYPNGFAMSAFSHKIDKNK